MSQAQARISSRSPEVSGARWRGIASSTSFAPETATQADARPPLRLTFGEIDRVRRSIQSGPAPP